MAVTASGCVSITMLDQTSLHKRRNTSNKLGSFLWTIIVFLSILSWTHAVDTRPSMNCENVKYSYEGKGKYGGVAPKDPLTGVQLRVCPKELTCCTTEMEHQLSAQSRQEFDKAVKDTLSKLTLVLKTRSQKFDEFFRALLSASKRDFHDMFKRTYGIIYEQNSYVFTDMFEELEKYYAKGQVDLGEAMENFFNTLYLKIFTVMNGQYHFDDKYLSCVGEHMKDLKPFGDVPHKLSVQLKRSFIATRTYSQALQVSSEVVNQMQKISPSPDCVRALLKMTGCPHCQGLPEVKACSNYCINVMKGCLAYQAELNVEWNNFVEQMEKVSERLLGPFNIEMVVEPINIKISEAIMNFQENGQEISQRVFQGCGKPVLGRRRRAAHLATLHFNALSYREHRDRRRARATDRPLRDPQQEDNELHFADQVDGKYDRPSLSKRLRRDTTELEFESLNFGRGADGQAATGPTLDKLVRDIRGKVRDSKQFWSNLPYTVCNDEQLAASPATDNTCWNGAMKAKYEPQIMGDGITNQQGNPEVAVDVSRPSSLLNEQLFALRTITNKLKNAYQGMDVEWIDNEETSSYDGSGSGSGDGITDNEVEGSGGHEHEVTHRPVDHGAEDKDLRPRGGQPKVKPADTTASGTAGQEMSLPRAVGSYLLPIVVMWFGGIFSDML